ncbi:Ig-like domain-containing protein, partial [bacterium]|nr:Ig-like domain-containing protein [bacterium]
MNATKLGRKLGIALAFVGLVVSCAKMGQPPGGPEDERGPQVEDVFPMPAATNVSQKIEVRVLFDEEVNRRSVVDAVFLSPDPGERVRFYWRGRLLRIRYLDSLNANRTYVITIGSAARDIRGNPISNPFTLAFSTGDHIDQGRIIGQISGEETPQNLNLWAYSLSKSAMPNPQEDIPEYRTQPNASGAFRFTYLKSDTYRVFAVFDAGRDGFWNPSVDKIGLPSGDMVVTDESQPYLSFKTSFFDTSAAQIRGISVKSDKQLVVKFSKRIPLETSFYLESFSGDTLSITAAYEDIDDSTHWQLFTARSLINEKWKLSTTLFDKVRAAQAFLDT